MTREEEIKARLETCYAKYIHWQSGGQDDSAEKDIEYLLARNEELQRRVKRMGRALVDCQFLFKNIKDYGAMRNEYDWMKVQKTWDNVNAALDAKEQDDDQAD